MDKFPDRVAVETRIHEAALDRADVIIPNFADEEDASHVVGKAIGPALAKVYSTRDQILQLQRSDFKDAVNTKRALEWLLSDLSHLERALFAEYDR
jgi:hypothetical protein